ncbi:MAG: thiamine pyrophosphate-binding protein, partial [Candidatus Aenigmatarchaeota archaeon]
KDAFQSANVEGGFPAFSKAVMSLSNGYDVEEAIKDAYHLAKSGKPGPVVIEFPFDKQKAEGVYRERDPEHYRRRYGHESHMSPDQCGRFFSMLSKSRKPLMYIGGGLNSEEGSRAMREFNSLFGIPYVNTLMAKGVMDEKRDGLSLGMLGMYGTPAANKAIQEADFFFAVGCRWDDRVADKVGEFGPKAQIAYIDQNEDKVREIIRERNPAFTFVGDAKSALKDLAEHSKLTGNVLDIRQWQEEAADMKRKWQPSYDAGTGFLQEAEVIDMLNRHLYDEDDLKITTGVGNHQMFSAQYMKMSRPKSFITSGSFGTMGFAMPAAVGACYANPGSKIIAIDGDGSNLMNSGELSKIAEYGLPVKILLLNNNADGMVKSYQKRFYGANYVGSLRNPERSFAGIAQAHGFPYAARVDGRDGLAGAMEDFLYSEGPSMLEVVTDIEEDVYPFIPPGKGYEEMLLGPNIKETDKTQSAAMMGMNGRQEPG